MTVPRPGTRVDAIVEHPAVAPSPIFAAEQFFPGLDRSRLEANLDWLAPTYVEAASAMVVLRVQSYLIRTPTLTVLVDPGVGNHKTRPEQPDWHRTSSARFEANLQRYGVEPGDVDIVVSTHLHMDHVGWNTCRSMGQWLPTFPRATYLFVDLELDYWVGRAQDRPGELTWIEDSVAPVLAAGVAHVVSPDHEISPEIALLPSPGHTPGHVCVRVATDSDVVLLTGDLVHSPLQARYPDLTMRADVDPQRAADSRRRILDLALRTEALIASAHLPVDAMMGVTRWQDGYALNAAR